MMDLPGHASSKESSDGPRLWSTSVPGTSKTSESASASIAASDCTAAAGADRESSCGGRSVNESLPEPLHLFRPVTQDTGSKIAILSFGGRGHGQPLSSIATKQRPHSLGAGRGKVASPFRVAHSGMSAAKMVQ